MRSLRSIFKKKGSLPVKDFCWVWARRAQTQQAQSLGRHVVVVDVVVVDVVVDDVVVDVVVVTHRTASPKPALEIGAAPLHRASPYPPAT